MTTHLDDRTATARTASTGGTARVDGRRLRRDQNRVAVIDAMLAFFDAGDHEPGIQAIAERAGISARSVFRYFDDLDDLARSAIEAQQQRLAPLWDLGLDPGLAFEERIARFVEHRVRLIDAMGHVGRVARLRAYDQPMVHAELASVRARLRRQVGEVFEPELRRFAPADAAGRLAAADVLCSFEGSDLMAQQGLAADAIRSAMSVALDALFRPPGMPRP